MSYLGRPLPNIPLLAPQQLPQVVSGANNVVDSYAMRVARQHSEDDLSPDDVSSKRLAEESRGLRLLLHSNKDNILLPFIQNVHWKREKLETVHGECPSIDCTDNFESCTLCLQHALPRSLPSALRQKYLRHDHAYTRNSPEEDLPIVERVAIFLIEKNYADKFEYMISNSEEKTTPFGSSMPSDDNGQEAQYKTIAEFAQVEDMETLLSSPWAKLDEVDVTIETRSNLVSDVPQTVNPEANADTSHDETVFIVKTIVDKNNPNSMTDTIIEKYSPLRNMRPHINRFSPSLTDPVEIQHLKERCQRNRHTVIYMAKPSLKAKSHRYFRGESIAHICKEILSKMVQRIESIYASQSAQPSLSGTASPDQVPAPTRVDSQVNQSAVRLANSGLLRRVTRGKKIDFIKLESCGEEETCEHIPSQPCPTIFMKGRLDMNGGTISLPVKRRASKAIPRAGALLGEPPAKRTRGRNTVFSQGDSIMIRPVFSSMPGGLFRPRCDEAPCNCCDKELMWPEAESTNQPLQILRGDAGRSDRTKPVLKGSVQTAPFICNEGCCSNLVFGGGSKCVEYPTVAQARQSTGNHEDKRISSKCSVCGIVFRAYGIVNGTLCPPSYANPADRLKEHEKFHKSNSLACVYPACKTAVFDSKDQLAAHMDAHRQMLMVAGVEQWENRQIGVSLLPPINKPHLTCDICCIDFNWRTTLPGMLSHSERFAMHCEKHRVRASERDCRWQCVLCDCDEKFACQTALEEHMWTVHAALCHCPTCDWIIWGDADEVRLHRANCTARLADVDFNQFNMSPTRESACQPSTSAPGSSSSRQPEAATRSGGASSRLMNSASKQRPKLLKNKTTKTARPSSATSKIDSAASANHLMRFSYYCEFCGAPFRSHHLKQYERHVQSHIPDKRFTCVFDHCGHEFSSIEELHSHVKTKLSTCRYCGAVLFENYKKHILTCRPLHEIKKQRQLREEFAKAKYAPVEQEDLHWLDNKLHCRNGGLKQSNLIPDSEAQERFLRTLNLVKGSVESITAKTRRHEQLRNQIHVANGKGRRSCTEKTSCTKCGRIFRNALNLQEHMRGYHNARNF